MFARHAFMASVMVCLMAGIGCASAGAAEHPAAQNTLTTPDAATQARLSAAYGKLPLLFEANKGQTDRTVKFTTRGPGYRMFLTGDAAVISLDAMPAAKGAPSAKTESAALRLRFVGARANAAVTGEAPVESKSNYFIGNDASRHVTDVPNFKRVRYAELYPGIDLVYYGNQRQLEYDFVLAPGADPAKIALAFDGAKEIVLDAQGDLVLRTSMGDFKQQRPQLYQEIDGRRRAIDGRYVHRSDATIGVEVAAYDASKPLIIDPVLGYSTFLGGSGIDYGTAIAVDASGNAYVTGYTNSTNFPVASPYQRALGKSAMNVFVAKLNPAGSGLVYSTYLGAGSETDYASGIAIDAAGNAYITGTTTGSTFPTTTGAYQKGVSGGGSFVAKLGPAGNTLLYSTYVLKAKAYGIAVDASNNAYITGAASTGFVTTGGAFQSTIGNAASTNAFVLKLNATGTAASYATFLGGSGTDVARGIAVDAGGNAYVGGGTTSPNFPVVSGVQPTLHGMQDGFVTKLNAAGNALIYSTYLGGEKDDIVNALAIDPAGSAYVAGETYSPAFPVTPYAFQRYKGGALVLNTNTSQGNGFVSKLAVTGDALIYSSFLGGQYCGYSYCTLYNPPAELPADAAYGIAVDSAGHAYVTGIVRTGRFPLVDSLVTTELQPLSDQDALFVTKVSQGGDALLYSTFVRLGAQAVLNTTLAGLPSDAGKGIALDGNGNAYGVADGPSNFPTTAGAFQPVNAGSTDAVVFKLAGPSAGPSVSLSALPSVASAGQAVQLTVTVPGAGSSGSVTLSITSRGYSYTKTVALTNGAATATITESYPGITAISAIYRNNDGNIADSPLLYLPFNPLAVCN